MRRSLDKLGIVATRTRKAVACLRRRAHIGNADGTAEAVIQKSPHERFVPATLLLYRFSPAIPPASRANIATTKGC